MTDFALTPCVIAVIDLTQDRSDNAFNRFASYTLILVLQRSQKQVKTLKLFRDYHLGNYRQAAMNRSLQFNTRSVGLPFFLPAKEISISCSGRNNNDSM